MRYVHTSSYIHRPWQKFNNIRNRTHTHCLDSGMRWDEMKVKIDHTYYILHVQNEKKVVLIYYYQDANKTGKKFRERNRRKKSIWSKVIVGAVGRWWCKASWIYIYICTHARTHARTLLHVRFPLKIGWNEIKTKEFRYGWFLALPLSYSFALLFIKFDAHCAVLFALDFETMYDETETRMENRTFEYAI